MEVGLDGRVALITGGSTGIGLATAQAMAESGATVVTVSRGAAPQVGEALHLAADLGEPGEPQRAVEAAQAQLGRVDVLVDNVAARRSSAGWRTSRTRSGTCRCG